jgi:hypothetical protein
MSFLQPLAKPLRWLRAGYPDQAPSHGHNPLLALMPASPAGGKTPDSAARIRPLRGPETIRTTRQR